MLLGLHRETFLSSYCFCSKRCCTCFPCKELAPALEDTAPLSGPTISASALQTRCFSSKQRDFPGLCQRRETLWVAHSMGSGSAQTARDQHLCTLLKFRPMTLVKNLSEPRSCWGHSQMTASFDWRLAAAKDVGAPTPPLEILLSRLNC